MPRGAPTFLRMTNLPMVASAVAMACALAFTSILARSAAASFRWICLNSRTGKVKLRQCRQRSKHAMDAGGASGTSLERKQE